MRKLKMKLADDKQYVFSTLTRRQCGAVQSSQKARPSFIELQELNKKEEEEGLSVEETDRVADLQEIEEGAFYDIIRMSMQRAHPEFALLDEETDDADQNKVNVKKNLEMTDALQDLLDMRDILILSTFALSGTVNLEEDANVKLGDIELS